MKNTIFIITAILLISTVACKQKLDPTTDMKSKVDAFVQVDLTTNIDHLSEKEKQMLPLLFEAAKLMDDVFWIQA